MKNVRTSKAAGTVHTVGAVSAATEVPTERAQFRALLVGNPNYFGTLPTSPFKPVIKLQGNTTYEELKCAGFHPQANRLDAVVFVNQQFGYGGDVCSSGSTSRSTTARAGSTRG